MALQASNVFQGYAQRVKNMAPFQVLFALEKRSCLHMRGFDVALGIILYLLENMLTYGKKNTYDDIVKFFHEQWTDQNLSYKEVYDAIVDLIYNHLRNQGRKLEFTYFNFETLQEETVYWDLLETEKPSFEQLKEKKMRLVLSNACIDMLFKTKEMFIEYQISITQLFLRQQIQKGVFDGALRTIDELNLSIRTKLGEMEHLEWDMRRDVLDFSRKALWEKQLQKNAEQFAREKEVFADLMIISKDSIRRHENDNLSDRERMTLQKAYEVQRRLHASTTKHDSLFEMQQRLQFLLTELITERVFSVFSTTLNIEQELLAPLTEKPERFAKAREFLLPLFHPKVPRWLMANQFYGPQKKQKRKEHIKETLELLDPEMVEEIERREKEEREARRALYARFFRFLFVILLQQGRCSYSELLHRADPELADNMQQPSFISFLLFLFQEKEVLLGLDDRIVASLPLYYRGLSDALTYDMEQAFRAFEMVPVGEKTVRLPNGIEVAEFEFCTIEREPLYNTWNGEAVDL
ncbi:hypothetical protein [Brevibacillus brevis]|uniref:Replicative DNA helicase n=1 Tax=Brevibacillus brevis TaxID=1393 RepID=A0A517ICM8_BREBE|nr:hypothetical protein [Brevibacillus brevis]QDS36635.1 hypothetical protein FPS98_23045 [Brevibacillus brevis]